MLKRFWLKSSRLKKAGVAVVMVIAIGFLVPENFQMPVRNACSADYNAESFWYFPWGKSGTHKGVDIFAKEGTPVLAATGGIVVYCGTMGMGGNVLIILGPKWRLHYYAHLQKQEVSMLNVVTAGDEIGLVGTSGNAKGKPPHLHYSLATVFPYFWRADGSPQGWKKIFYLDPTPKLNGQQ